jgi:hypothetical protein
MLRVGLLLSIVIDEDESHTREGANDEEAISDSGWGMFPLVEGKPRLGKYEGTAVELEVARDDGIVLETGDDKRAWVRFELEPSR